MALRQGLLKPAGANKLGFLRTTQMAAIAPSLNGSIHDRISPQQMIFPELTQYPHNINCNGLQEVAFPSFSLFDPMQLMAVPKKKVSPHKRGIRNGPKALKPTPVIMRCRSCGRVKLPHFYCCSGERGKPEDHNNNQG